MYMFGSVLKVCMSTNLDMLSPSLETVDGGRPVLTES